MFVPFAMQAQFTATFGTGTSETSTGGAAGAPMSYGGAYSWCQQIYRAAEFTAAGVPAGAIITSISFYNATGATTMPDIRTYMGHRSTAYFSGTSDWAPYNTLTLVDSGDWVAPAGWFEIQLDQPFIWNGTDNVVVGVSFRGAHSDYNTNNPNCGYQYTSQGTGNNAHIRRFSTTLSSCDPTSTAAANSVSPNRPNLRISYILSGCPSLSPNVASVTAYTADLNWINYNQSVSYWDLAYGEASTFDTLTATIVSSITDTFYTLTGLLPATNYIAKLKPYCSNGTGSWSASRTFSTAVTCPAPTNVQAASVLSDGCTLTWTAGASETNWDIYVPTGTEVPSTSTTPTASTTTPTYSITGLSAVTEYTVYVRANCGYDDYSFWIPVTFRTACGAITTLPYTENFDSYGTGESAYPTCWEKINTYSSNRPYINTTHYGSGVGSLYFFTGTSGTYNIAVTPPFDPSISISGMQAVFMYRATNSSDRLIVGVMSNPTDASTFVPVDTVYPASPVSTWVEKTIYFNNYTGTGQYIAFKNEYTTTSSYAYIDNVEIGNIPTCPKPLSLTATAVTTNSITLSWNDPSSATSWNIEYSTSSFTPGTGAGTVVTATSNPFTVTGLTASTNYTFYVQADCGGGDLSYFSEAHTASTACDFITTLPYTENFDSYAGATTTSVSTNNLPNCWNHINTGTNTSYSGYPIIYNSTTYAASGTNAMRFYTYTTAGTYDDHLAILPPFDPTTLPMNTLQLSFDARALSTSYPFTLVVGILTNPTDKTTFLPVDTLTLLSTVYENFEIPFANYTGTGAYIGIMAPQPTANYNYGYVDNIMVNVLPDCIRPSHVTVGSITSSSVTVNWLPGDQESMWEVAVVPQGQSITNVTPETATAYPYTVSNLTDDTPYTVYVRAICPSGGYSSWTSAVSFRTDPWCTSPRNVTVSQITGTSALVSWDAALVGATDYTVEYTEYGLNSWTNMLVSGTSVLLPSLIPQTSYTVRVSSNCAQGTALPVTVNFTTHCLSGGLVEIGAGTTTSTYLPSYSGSTRSYSQQIFKKSELGAAGTIDTLSIQLSSINSSANRSISIYLVHTSAEAIYSWVPTTGAQLVYSGTTNWHTGWNAIPLTTPFAYNGVDNLLMVVIDNTASSVSSPYNTYKTHSAFACSARYATGSTYSIGSVPSATGTSMAVRNNIKFHIDCDNTVTCVAPNVAPTNVTDESITLEWAPGYMESSWDLEYRIGNGTWISEGTVTTSPYTLSNLQSGTMYGVRLRSDCGGTYSEWSGFNIRTECSSVTIPYSENFDNAPGSGAGNMVPCWTRNTNSTTAYPYTNSSYSHSGGYSVYFYGTSTYYSYIASPRFDDMVQMNNLQIRFWAYKTSPTYQIEVGIMSDPDDFSTFESLGQVSPSNNSLWQKFEVNTNLYTGTGRYIAFRMPTNITSYMYLDDVEVYEIPSCDHVDNIHAVGTPTTTSINVGWTPRGTETQWNVVYGPRGAIADPSQETPTVVYTPSLSLTNLVHSTFYDVYVQSDCGSETSVWEKGTVHTACDLISTLPFSENFDDYIPGTTSSNVIPICWSHLNTGTSYPGCPTVYNASSYASSGTQCLYFYATTASGYGDQYAILPQVDVNTLPINTLRLSFKARRYTSTASYVNTIIVGVMTNPASASSFVPVDTVTLTSTTIGTHHVDFTNYTGTGSYIAIKVPKPDGSTFTSASPNYIDDVMLDVAPACAYPTNLQVSNVTTTGATVNWTAGSTETEWEMVVVAGNAPISTGTTYNVYTNSETLTGLTAGTNYTIYLRAVCPQSGYSEYVTTSFATQCEDLQTLPFTCNFDNVPGSTSGTTNNLPICWTHHSGTYSSYAGYPIVYSGSSYAASGTNSLRFYTYTGTSDYGNQYAVLPPIDVNYNPINSLQMTLDVRKYSTSYSNFTLIVGVMSDPSSVSTFVPIDTIVQTETTYHTYTVYFNNYTGTGKNIAIYAPTHGMNGISYNSGYVDNIVVEPIPACPPVMNFSVSNVAGASALLTWEEGIAGMATDFIVEYSEYNQSNWTTETGITSTTYFLSGLNPQTHYDVRVKANCGVSESTWKTADFTTGCLAGGDHLVGTGTTTNYYLPVNNFYRYTYSQQIFLASEMNGPTDIQSISFQYAYSSPSTKKNSVNIYLGHTTQSVFTGTSNYVPLDSLTLVYSGNLNCTQGWNTFNFNTVFHYNGTSNLVVAVDDNSNDYDGSAYTFYVHSAGANRSLYYYSDSNNPSPSNPTSVSTSSSYSSGNRSNVKFGGPCDNTVTCIAPNMAVSALDQTSATVIWAPGNTESSWNLEYKPIANTLWTSVTGITGNTYTITGLTPSTRYDVRMQSDCGSEVSSWITADFMTDCGEITNLPYAEYFDTYATGENGEFPTCWGKINTYSANRPYVYNTGYSSSGSLYFYTGSAGTYNIAATPPFDASINISDLQAVFMYKATNSTDRLIVGVMSNPTDASTFVPVDTVYPASPVSTWVEKTVYFHNYTGSGHYIAFKNEYTTTGCYAYIDNLEIGNIPTCPKPISLTATAVTSNSITLGWTDLSTASSWNIEYGQGTFTPGSGVGTSETAYSNPYTITGLTANTSYTFYVQTDCGGGDLSYFSSAYTVSTACGAVDSLPFAENFDSYAGATSTSVSVNNLPNCWSYINTGTNSSYTGYPIIYNSSSYTHSGANVLRFYAGTGTYGDEMAILPPIDENLYPINTLQVSFYARALNTTYPFKLVVGVLSNPASMSSFTPIDTLTITSTTHALFEIPLGHYSGTGNYIGLLAPQPVSGMNYGYVDDIMVDLMPSCPKPTNLTVSNLTTTSLDLNWVENGTAGNWVVEYGLSGFTQGTGTAVQVQGTPSTTITGLSASTTYDFYVRADCGGGDVSGWTSLSVTTLCDAVTTLPFTENFDNYGTGTATAYPPCWFKYSTYTASAALPYCSATNYQGTGSLYLYVATSGTYNMAITPAFDNTIPVSTLQATFMYRASNSTDRLVVGVMSDPTNPNTFVPVDTIYPASTASSWVSREVNFSHYTGSGHHIAFMNHYTTTYCYTYVDNLVIDVIPTCPRPSHLTASNPTTSSLTLSWTENGSATNWVVEYGPAGFTQGTGSTVQVTGTPSTTITGLSASTVYDFYVKSDCGGGDESAWSTVGSGNTSCGVITSMPYSEGFDSYGTGTSVYPLCWSKINTYTSADRPYVNSTHYAGVGSLYFFAGSASTYNIAITPEFDSSIPMNGLTATFMYRGTYTSDRLIVGVMSSTTNASTFVPVDTVYVSSSSASTWVSKTVSFANYTGNGHYIAFKNAYTTQGGYGYIDNLVISSSVTPSTCTAPTGVAASNVSQTSATITWTAGGTETAWELQYKAASASSWSNSINVMGTPSHNLTGLTAGTQYQVRVRAVCSATETSNWSATATFTTTQPTVTPPTVTTQAADNISSSAATLHGTVTAGSETITSQGFEWKVTTGGTYAAVSATGTTMSYNLSNLSPSTDYTFRAFAITASGTTYGAAMTFTTQTPQQDTCPTPTNVTVSNITETTADISWTQVPGTANSWDLNYKESGASSWYTVTTSSNPFTLAGLTSGSSYDVQVIAHCTNGVMSDPSATYNFMTVGIDDHTLDNSVTVYPNPTSGLIQIENGEWRMENVEVYDVYGKLLSTVEVFSNNATLDLSGYAKGTYFVRVTTEKGVVTKRVVKN